MLFHLAFSFAGSVAVGREGGGGGERERERDRERQRHRQRQTDRQKETERDRDRQRDRDREGHRQIDRQTDRQKPRDTKTESVRDRDIQKELEGKGAGGGARGDGELFTLESVSSDEKLYFRGGESRTGKGKGDGRAGRRCVIPDHPCNLWSLASSTCTLHF